jgi:hypothetical protein
VSEGWRCFEAEKLALATCGRKKTPTHRIVAMKWLMRWDVIASGELNTAMDEWRAYKERHRQHLREAGLASSHGFRVL